GGLTYISPAYNGYDWFCHLLAIPGLAGKSNLANNAFWR
ncbi:unnamed protein product, partial [marine sediment metagenome]